MFEQRSSHIKTSQTTEHRKLFSFYLQHTPPGLLSPLTSPGPYVVLLHVSTSVWQAQVAVAVAGVAVVSRAACHVRLQRWVRAG